MTARANMKPTSVLYAVELAFTCAAIAQSYVYVAFFVGMFFGRQIVLCGTSWMSDGRGGGLLETDVDSVLAYCLLITDIIYAASLVLMYADHILSRLVLVSLVLEALAMASSAYWFFTLRAFVRRVRREQGDDDDAGHAWTSNSSADPGTAPTPPGVEGVLVRVDMFAKSFVCIDVSIDAYDDSDADDADLCAICLRSLASPVHDEYRLVMPCAHSLHFTCANEYVKRRNRRCPVCRARWM